MLRIREANRTQERRQAINMTHASMPSVKIRAATLAIRLSQPVSGNVVASCRSKH